MTIEIRHRITNEILYTHKYNSLEGVNLSGVNLEGANLRGTNLKGVNLKGVNLRVTNLKGANLREANLEVANVIEVNLEVANLIGTNLERANLRGANLRGTNLTGVNLKGTNLTGVNLEGAKGIIHLKTEIWDTYITSNHIKIGCQYHTFEKWKSFSDLEISKMHPKALDFWKEYKEEIFLNVEKIKNDK